jgi:DNA helicase-2/ATP-dependent DNA helicase PcrA
MSTLPLFDFEPQPKPSDHAARSASQTLSGLQMNAAQRRAIEHTDGPLLVIAGAGTGKTRVITERIRHVLEQDETLTGENILGLTFTLKAAGEMKARVMKTCGERAAGITLSTFHSFCESLLKETKSGRLLLDKVDHWILLRRNMRRLQLDKYRRLAEPGQFLSDFIEFFSRCQDELVSSADYERYAEGLAAKLEAERALLDEDTYGERLETVEQQREIARAYRASEELLREKNRLTFGSLITGAIELLEKDAALREQLQQRFRHILVDEFQDTNIAQLRLIELLAGQGRNVIAVGDNDQAIYRFRGASFGSFQIFLQRFANWKKGDDSSRYRVTLTENYRSTPNILRVATEVISHNEVSADFPTKSLTAVKPEGEKIRIAEVASPEAEAQWVADEIERLHNAGRKWRDIAILYRQHAHRDGVVEQLAQRGIPFAIAGLSILDHPLVKDVIANLRLIVKPYDDVACARVLSAPAWKLQPESLLRLTEKARGKKGAKSLFDALQLPQGQLPFDAAHPAPTELLAFHAAQRKKLRKNTARETLDDVIEWLEVAQRAAERDRKYVRRLVEFAKEWEAKSETRSLTEFVEYLEYFQQANGSIALDDDAPGDAVQLMTVHGAKGLEFSHVFVLRVNSGSFPPWKRPMLFEFPVELMKEELPEGDFHIQEERRLFYVALTRAQDRLTLTTFIEDMLMDPAVKRRDVRQIAPKLADATEEENGQADAGEGSLFQGAGEPPRIFSRIAAWAETFHPAPFEPLTLSPSAVAGYRACPQQYLFERMWMLRGTPKATYTFGRVMHSTIRRVMLEFKKGNRLAFEDAERIYQMEWSDVGFEDEYQEEEYKKDGLEQLRTFHAALTASAPEILEQERGFELALPDNVVVNGRIDQINSLGKTARSHEVEVVDYKTGTPRKQQEANKDLQLSVYAIAAKEILELNPVKLVFHYLQNNERQETTRNAKQLDEAQRVILETAANIRAGDFPAKPGFQCRSCAYRAICPAYEERLAAQPG